MKKRFLSIMLSLLIFTALGVCAFTAFAAESTAVSQSVIDANSYNLNYNSQMAVGTKQQVQVIMYNGQTAPKPSFTSSNTSVATVTSSGVITAKGTGSATIKYSPDGNSSKSITVNVKAMPKSLSVSASVKSVNEGQSFSLNAKVNSGAYPTNIRYTTTNSNIVSVSSSGVVTARGEGKAVVTAITENGVRANCTVYVYSNSGISLNKTSAKVAMDKSNVTKVVYGKSVLGRDLEAYVINGNGNNSKTLFCTFAVHGFEDNYDHDGKVLVNIANDLVTYYSNYPSELRDYRIVIVPCANPDGTIDGKNNLRTGSSAFGRCTASHVDMNRDFISGKFKGQESRALRDLMKSYKMDVYIDFHGWLNTVLGNGSLVDIFRSTNGLSRDQTGSYGTSQGYIIGWVNENLGAKSALVEFKSPSTCHYTKVASGISRVVSGSYHEQSSIKYEYTNSIPAAKNLRSTSVSTTSVNLSWNAVSGAKGYQIQYIKNGSSWSSAEVFGKTSGAVSGLDPGASYYFRVRGFTYSGNVRTYSNNFSSSVTVSTKPDAVANFKASGRTSDGSAIILNWTQKLNADGYNLYQQTNGNWVKIATLEGGMSGNYRVTTKADTKYTFAIEAYKGSSSNVSSKTTYTTYSSTAAPANFYVNAVSSNVIRATWTAKSGVGYYIQYATDSAFTKNTGGIFVDAGKNYCEFKTDQYSKNYYVRIRSCRSYGSEQIVGGYSKTLSTKDSLFRPYGFNVYARGNGGKAVYLSWSKSDGAQGYKVYIVSGSNKILKGTTTQTKFTFTDLTPAWEYDVVVEAYNASRTSASSTYRICAAPAPVSGISAVLKNDNTTANISWKTAACHGYYIQWSTDRNFNSNVSGAYIEGSANTSYTVKLPSAADNFYVRVRAFKYYNNARVFGDFSSPYSLEGLLTAPSNFSVYARGDGGTDLYLDWKDVKNADGYKVYIVSGSDSYFKGDTTESKFTFTDLVPAWEYDVKVVAYNDKGKEASAVYHVCAAPAPVEKFSVSLQSSGTAKLTWSQTASHGYYVQWATDEKFTKNVGGEYVSGTSCNLDLPGNIKDYYVRIRAWKWYKDAKLYGDFSAAQFIGDKLSAPKGYNVYARGAGGKNLYLEWDKVDGADGYKVYIVSGNTKYYKGDVTEARFIFTDLTPAWEYDVMVVAYNEKCSVSSNYHICAAPAPVREFEVSAVDDSTVKASWSVEASHGYYIQWATDENFTQNVEGEFISGSGSTTKKISVDGDVSDYYFRVRVWKYYEGSRLFSDFSAPLQVSDNLNK